MSYSYATIIRDAQRARWSLEEVTDGLSRLDFGRPFLPDSLVQIGDLGLPPDETLIANHIRAHSYLNLFATVERFILPFVMLAAGQSVHASSEKLLALMQFGEEEAKHIALFERFSQAFELGFGSECQTVGPTEHLASIVLAEDPLGIALLVLHIEWMTQDHFLRSARQSSDIDEQFKTLLRCHWLEEAQHARLDTLLIESMVEGLDAEGRERASHSYVRLLDRLAELLGAQVELDLEAFARAATKPSATLEERWRAQQTTAYRDAFLRTGVDHPKLRKLTRQAFPAAEELLDAASYRFAFVAARANRA